jgi:hypothetical protein
VVPREFGKVDRHKVPLRWTTRKDDTRKRALEKTEDSKMQNRYVGDVGDFAKYALLRRLAQERFSLGIVWYLFGDERHNSDGRHTSYLWKPEFRSLDPQLHERLALIVNSGRRSVRRIAETDILPPNTIFFDLPIMPFTQTRTDRAAREAHRAKWLSRALVVTVDCELVFFDPDNGIETRCVPRHVSKAGKYVFWDELKLFWNRGQSLVVYHHLNRSASIREQSEALKRKFADQFSDAGVILPLLFRRGSCRHFWIVGQAKHAAGLRSGVETMLRSGWSSHFKAC